MTNLPIPSSNSQPASNSAVANTVQKSDPIEAQSANPFGAVLARTMQGDEGSTSNANSQPDASAIEVKETEGDVVQTGKIEQDKTLAAVITGDPSSALAAMLQLPQNIKLALERDAAATAAPRVVTDAAVAAGTMAGTTMLRKANANKAELNQPVANAGTMQSKAKFSLPAAAAPTGKPDFAATVADTQALHSSTATDFIKFAELPNSIPDAARSAQNIAQTASSMVTSGMSPNILTPERAVGGMQAISSPLGSNGWTEEFSQKISWMGTQQNQVAELHLNPPNLGPLDVVLKISDNQATALFTSPHSAVREAVENALPRLREILADNGIMLGNATVSDQSPRDRGAEGFADKGTGTALPREISGGLDRTAESSSPSIQSMPVRRHNGMVDTFA